MNRPTSDRVYRVDKFVVPAAARDEFIDRVQRVHKVLRIQAGFVRDVILEKRSGPGEFNIVTVVEWESAAVTEGARRAVMEMHARDRFDPQQMYLRLGIRADIASYGQVGPLRRTGAPPGASSGH